MSFLTTSYLTMKDNLQAVSDNTSVLGSICNSNFLQHFTLKLMLEQNESILLWNNIFRLMYSTRTIHSSDFFELNLLLTINLRSQISAFLTLIVATTYV
jgi:hypothetical protein